MRSIASSAYRTIFINGAAGLIVVIVAVWIGYGDLERTWMSADLQEEVKLLHEDAVAGRFQTWKTHDVTALYVPNDHPASELPDVFKDVPIPFAGPYAHQGKKYQLVIQIYPEGTYYLARDITSFEQRERIFKILLIALAFALILLNFFLSKLQGRRLVQPLRQLTAEIRLATSQSMTPVKSDYRDIELTEIALAINGFIAEIDAFVGRERNLLNLASHELRTPITVVSGAVQILEQRGSLSPEDRKTLTRIKHAINDMQDNVTSLLTLARRSKGERRSQRIVLSELLEELLEEIGAIDAAQASRIHLHLTSLHSVVESDRTLVKMLVRNLVQNALQHTSASVELTLDDSFIDIRDHGPGLSVAVKAAMHPSASSAQGLEGLGLFIVTLICEYIGWRVEAIDSSEGGGTCFRVGFSIQ